jgi:hypothetical protein
MDVGDGFGESRVGGNQVLDGGVLLNSPVCKIVEGRSHLLHQFEFSGLFCKKCCVPNHHLIDVAHFGEGSGPMGFSVGPCMVRKRATFPLAPGQRHVAAC